MVATTTSAGNELWINAISIPISYPNSQHVENYALIIKVVTLQ